MQLQRQLKVICGASLQLRDIYVMPELNFTLCRALRLWYKLYGPQTKGQFIYSVDTSGRIQKIYKRRQEQSLAKGRSFLRNEGE